MYKQNVKKKNGMPERDRNKLKKFQTEYLQSGDGNIICTYRKKGHYGKMEELLQNTFKPYEKQEKMVYHTAEEFIEELSLLEIKRALRGLKIIKRLEQI